MQRLTICLMAALALPVSLSAAETLTYDQLVNRLIDLEHLAQLPAPAERCAQWSSYDRASRYDEATGKYVKWDANNDGPMYIRREGSEYVLAEMTGPGCIWRIWSADAKQGRVKIYIDGQPQPAVDLPFIHYFDGKHAPFAYRALSYDLRPEKSAGQNLYYPIPYQRSCKVVAEEGWGRYFHFVYTTYPAGTQLPGFSAALAEKSAAALSRVDDFLRNRLGTDPVGRRPGQQSARWARDIPAGAAVEAALLDGPAAITALRVKTQFANRDEARQCLRRVALRITWDGEKNPSVWSPLGDFFGTAPGENFYKTLVTGMTRDGYYALWYMPFAKSAKVELVNDDGRPHRVELELTTAPLARPFAGLAHFHAKWHRDTVELPADRWPDWVMLNTKGQGRFCGVMLHVWNPLGGWWGEGDEKFFVDGEKFPSTIGTGSEDYFGYAWCNPHYFEKPYHAQSMTENNRGHQSVLRWHVVDNVPFQQSFEGCIEKYYKTAEKGTQYALLATWYQAPGSADGYAAVPVAQRDNYYLVPERMAGGFKVLNTPRGDVHTQEMGHFGAGKWEKNDQLWWTGAAPGAYLQVAFTATSAAKQELVVCLTKARDYGIVQFDIDGKAAGEPVDLYSPNVVPSGPVSLGVHQLAAGPHKLGIKIVGANRAALPKYMVGLDKIELKPAP